MFLLVFISVSLFWGRMWMCSPDWPWTLLLTQPPRSWGYHYTYLLCTLFFTIIFWNFFYCIQPFVPKIFLLHEMFHSWRYPEFTVFLPQVHLLWYLVALNVYSATSMQAQPYVGAVVVCLMLGQLMLAVMTQDAEWQSHVVWDSHY